MSNLAKVWQKQLSYDSKTVQIFHKTEKLTDIFLSQTSFHVAKSVKYCWWNRTSVSCSVKFCQL